MGILDRVSQLVRANVNDMLDRAEDPEKMINQILRDMQENIGEARKSVAAMIAQEKELEIDLNQTRKLSSEWQSKAERAVSAGKDDLAREALRRKKDNDENAAVYEQQLTVQEQAVQKLKSQLTALESKYQSTLSQRDSLVARQRRAEAQKKVTSSLTTFSPLDPSGDLERMERKIRQNEAQAAAQIEMHDDTLDAQFKELDYDQDVEDELSALKQSLNPSALPESTTEPASATPSDSSL
jgi:phage shock protein A